MRGTLIPRRRRWVTRLFHRGRSSKVAPTPWAQKFKMQLTRARFLRVSHPPTLKLVHQGAGPAAGLLAVRTDRGAALGGTAARGTTADVPLGTRAAAAPPGGEGSPGTISPVPLRPAALLRAGVEAVPGVAGTARPLLAGDEAPPHVALLREPAAAAAEGAARPGATPQEGAAHLGATPQEGAGVVGFPLLPVTSREAQPPLL